MIPGSLSSCLNIARSFPINDCLLGHSKQIHVHDNEINIVTVHVYSSHPKIGLINSSVFEKAARRDNSHT